jgi:hypothetical protein
MNINALRACAGPARVASGVEQFGDGLPCGTDGDGKDDFKAIQLGSRDSERDRVLPPDRRVAGRRRRVPQHADL